MMHKPHSIPPSFRLWLNMALCAVFLMVAIGGLTRLTESGLSIVEWKLVTGTLPPLSTEAWNQEFVDYQQTPEFKKKNSYMALEDFKRIYWLEYLHRLLGRVIGLLFLLPFMYYALRRNLPSPLLKQMGGMLLLVCAQGMVGWYMVKSGLVHDPWVSPYRLAFHLSLAATLFCWLAWVRMKAEDYRYSKPQVKNLPPQPTTRRSFAHAQGDKGLLPKIIFAAIFLQLIFGAFVAGLDAGYTYNTFPLMDGQFFPPHMLMLKPVYRNFFEHIPAVQFVHRWFAFVVLALIFWQWLRAYQPSALLVVGVALVQVMLGIATLLSVVDISLASLHQLVAFLLLVVQLRHMFHVKHGLLTKNSQKPVLMEAARQ